MTENLRKLLQLVSKDEALKKELKNCANLPREELYKKLIEISKNKGINLSEIDLDERKLDSEELKQLTGGACIVQGDYKECTCFMVGYNKGFSCAILGIDP